MAVLLPSIDVDVGSLPRYIDVCQYLWKDGLMPTRELLPVIALDACCSVATGDAMSVQDADMLARALKALADPARLRLLSMVAAHDDDEACVCDLTESIGLSQPTVSHHLKVLTDAGFLTRSKRGTWAYYRLVPEALGQVSSLLVAP